MPRRRHRTIERVTQILELVAGSREGYTLTEIARRLQEPKSSIQTFVYGLLDQGYLDCHRQHYTLGPSAYRLSLCAGQMPIHHVPHDEVVALSEELGCQLFIGIIAGRHMMYVDFAGDNMMGKYISGRMMRFPLFDATGGMVLMAEMESRDLHELLKDEEDQDKIPGILAQLDEIRRQGFVVADSRLVPGAGAIATVIRDSGGAPVAAATLISSPDDIAARQDLLVRRVRDFADKIQHAIPHRPR